VVNVIEQLPDPDSSVAVQVSPVLAVTCTVPVGVLLPVTCTAIVTAWPAVDGFGEVEVMTVVETAFWTVRAVLESAADANVLSPR